VYEDTGGDGAVLVLLGSVLMDGSVWDPVVANLRRDHRCVIPSLPPGAHRGPMRRDADLSLRDLGRMVTELLARLDLREVTVVANNHGAALALAAEHPDQPIARLGRLVVRGVRELPAGPARAQPAPGSADARSSAAGTAGAAPAAPAAPARDVRLDEQASAARRAGRPLAQAGTAPAGRRRDLRAYLVGARRGHMVAVCEQLAGFGRPTLWYGRRGRVQRPQHGCRLVTVLPTLGWPRSPTATC
jgi:pimeloyl-ACP methyl ester carboxylesterase